MLWNLHIFDITIESTDDKKKHAQRVILIAREQFIK